MVLDKDFPELLEQCLNDVVSILELMDNVRQHIFLKIEEYQTRMALLGSFPTKHQCFITIVIQAAFEPESGELHSLFAG